jgi:predicted lipoprotein with Yx(FWY)xxD motif
MNNHVRRSCMAMALAGALFSAHAGAMSSQAPASAAFDVISSPQTLTLLEADGAMTTYTFADPELAAVAAPDGMVTVYELAPFAPLSEPVIDSVVFTSNYYFPMLRTP